MSLADIQAKIALAVAANEAADYATAIRYLRSAQIMAAGVPNVNLGNGQSLAFNGLPLDAAIASLQRQLGSKSGLTYMKTQPALPTGLAGTSGDY